MENLKFGLSSDSLVIGSECIPSIHFDSDRRIIWLNIWANALLLSLITREYGEFAKKNHPWLEGYFVDILAQRIWVPGGLETGYAESDLTEDSAETIRCELNIAFELFTEFMRDSG